MAVSSANFSRAIVCQVGSADVCNTGRMGPKNFACGRLERIGNRNIIRVCDLIRLLWLGGNTMLIL